MNYSKLLTKILQSPSDLDEFLNDYFSLLKENNFIDIFEQNEEVIVVNFLNKENINIYQSKVRWTEEDFEKLNLEDNPQISVFLKEMKDDISVFDLNFEDEKWVSVFDENFKLHIDLNERTEIALSKKIIDQLLNKMQMKLNDKKNDDFANIILYLNNFKELYIETKHFPENKGENDIDYNIMIKFKNEDQKIEEYIANFDKKGYLVNEVKIKRDAQYGIINSSNLIDEKENEKITFLDYFCKIFEKRIPSFKYQTEKEVEFKNELISNFNFILDKNIIVKKDNDGYSFLKKEKVNKNNENIVINCLIHQDKNYKTINQAISNCKNKIKEMKIDKKLDERKSIASKIDDKLKTTENRTYII